MKNEIIAECCNLFDIHPRDLVGPTRFGFLMPARFAMYKALASRGWAYAQIGAFLNRDRTTVRHGITRAEYMARRDPDYADKVQHLIDFQPPYLESQT